MHHTNTILPVITDIAEQAGAYIMRHYRGDHAVTRKEDASPVTETDREADRYIVARLKEIDAGIPVVSEEGEKPDVSGAEYFWLVDPLDGTKSFIRGSGYFTVNIALVQHHRDPVLGVIYEPVGKTLYYGSKAGAFKTENGKTHPISMRLPPAAPAAIVSHSHLDKNTEQYLAQNAIVEKIPCASSIKFCFLAEGKADIYPRFGPTMEWDIAAGHAILQAAGGTLVTPEGQPFTYGKKDFLNGNFIARKRG